MSAAKILAGLIKLRDPGPQADARECGICYNLSSYSEVSYSTAIAFVQERAVHWPEYSGSMDYPVPGGEAEYDRHAVSGGNQWDKSTEYGQARYRLLDFLIERCEAELKEVQP